MECDPLAPPECPGWPAVGHFPVVALPSSAFQSGSHLTHSPTEVIQIPAASAEAKPMRLSGGLGSTLPNSIVFDKVIKKPH